MQKNDELKISYININGLNKNKINDTDMIKDMDNANIICFSETHLKEEDDFPTINNYSGEHTTGKKSLKSGRNIKGISVYLKDNLDNVEFENIVNENGTMMITKINSKKTGAYRIYI